MSIYRVYLVLSLVLMTCKADNETLSNDTTVINQNITEKNDGLENNLETVGNGTSENGFPSKDEDEITIEVTTAKVEEQVYEEFDSLEPLETSSEKSVDESSELSNQEEIYKDITRGVREIDDGIEQTNVLDESVVASNKTGTNEISVSGVFEIEEGDGETFAVTQHFSESSTTTFNVTTSPDDLSDTNSSTESTSDVTITSLSLSNKNESNQTDYPSLEDGKPLNINSQEVEKNSSSDVPTGIFNSQTLQVDDEGDLQITIDRKEPNDTNDANVELAFETLINETQELNNSDGDVLSSLLKENNTNRESNEVKQDVSEYFKGGDNYMDNSTVLVEYLETLNGGNNMSVEETMNKDETNVEITTESGNCSQHGIAGTEKLTVKEEDEFNTNDGESDISMKTQLYIISGCLGSIVFIMLLIVITIALSVIKFRSEMKHGYRLDDHVPSINDPKGKCRSGSTFRKLSTTSKTSFTNYHFPPSAFNPLSYAISSSYNNPAFTCNDESSTMFNNNDNISKYQMTRQNSQMESSNDKSRKSTKDSSGNSRNPKTSFMETYEQQQQQQPGETTSKDNCSSQRVNNSTEKNYSTVHLHTPHHHKQQCDEQQNITNKVSTTVDGIFEPNIAGNIRSQGDWKSSLAANTGTGFDRRWDDNGGQDVAQNNKSSRYDESKERRESEDEKLVKNDRPATKFSITFQDVDKDDIVNASKGRENSDVQKFTTTANVNNEGSCSGSPNESGAGGSRHTYEGRCSKNKKDGSFGQPTDEGDAESSAQVISDGGCGAQLNGNEQTFQNNNCSSGSRTTARGLQQKRPNKTNYCGRDRRRTSDIMLDDLMKAYNIQKQKQHLNHSSLVEVLKSDTRKGHEGHNLIRVDDD